MSVTFSSDAEARPVLPTAGEYTEGAVIKMANGDEVEVKSCELTEFAMPSTDHENQFVQNPAYDKEGKKGPYAFFHFKVVLDPNGIVDVRHWESYAPHSRSRVRDFLIKLGVAVENLGNGQFSFEPDEVAPRPCSVTVGDPKGDGRYTGNLRDVSTS